MRGPRRRVPLLRLIGRAVTTWEQRLSRRGGVEAVCLPQLGPGQAPASGMRETYSRPRRCRSSE